MSYFIWLVSMIPEFLLYFWPVSLALLAFTLLGLKVWLQYEPRSALKGHILYGSLLFTLLILIYGTVHAAQGENWTPQPLSQIGPFVVLGMLMAQLGVNFLWLVRAGKGSRVLLSATFGWEFALSFSAGVIALMSVSGDWL